ncbi:MAG: SAM-dependent methyltransferase [Actinobacteria bacterium]|nr:SAM-dependent methyltransferase [Actinomycetota bacterium]
MSQNADSSKASLPEEIAATLLSEGGRVTFARFMEIALASEGGYYQLAARFLGHAGDFSTAPSLSDAFNKSVALLLGELIDAARSAVGPPMAVVELGGGEGHLARAVMSSWEGSRQDLRGDLTYCIVEIGPGLVRKQTEALSDLCEAGWDVRWGPTMNLVSAGVNPMVIIGNEFIDALPIHIVDVSAARAREAWVLLGTALTQEWGELSPPAAAELESLFGSADPMQLRPLTRDGIIELRPGVARLMCHAAENMPAGSLVTIDYGDWFEEETRLPSGTGTSASFRPSKALMKPAGARRRTVRGYFRHQISDDPLERAGRQDLTADVDFRALDLHGRQAGFETVVFTSLAAFLAAGGAGQDLEPPRELPCCLLSDPLEADRQASILEALLDEDGLGGVFKVMIQVRE